jgi:hypothetical protein
VPNLRRVQHGRFPLRALQLALVAFAVIASTEKTPAAAFGTKTALVMLVSLTNAPIDCTIAEVNGFVFTNSPLSVDSYFDHSTWGNVRWSGNVIAVTVGYGTGSCSQDAWADAADSAALGLGYNPANYTARVYAFPSVMGSCGYALAAGNRVMNWHCSDLFAYGHEIGHTIGMHHASTDHNNDGVIEGEYGGLDDCMGGESFTHNAPHKIWGGWLPQKAGNGGWRQITTDGSYQISPLEINPTNNPPYSQALKIVPPTGWPYFLSYRQALDFDQGWTAAQVGKDGRSGTINDPTLSMNSYPYAYGVSIHRHSGATGVQTLEIAVLGDNQQFTIPGTGIVIRQISHDANQVTLNITGFGGGTAPLGVTFYQDSLYGGSQGQVLPAGNYTLSQLIAKGVPNDWASSCKVPSGWTVTMYQADNFLGTVWTLTTNTPSFSALSPSANDQLSSVQIVSGPAAAPPVPTDLSAIAGNAQVRLSWTATPGATGYNVKRATVSGGPYSPVASPSVSSYQNGGLTNGITYYYVVSATNSVGSSSDTAQVSATPVNDLVGRWKFDENSGLTTADSSGNNNTGSLVNGPTWVAGKVGPAALSFSAGGLQSVTAANSSSLNSPVSAITLAAWINAVDWSGNRRILQKGNSDNQYRLLAENGVLKFHLSGVDTLTAPLPPTGTWMHIAATWDGSLMTLYTNGVQRTNLPAAGSIATTSDLLAIAKKNTSGVSGDYFNGRLDDVRIYNRALSAAEVAVIMTNAPPLFAVDPFNKASGNAGQTYSGSLSTNATDRDADALVFSKSSGPAWLTVAANGTLGGTPFSDSAGLNTFIVRATDTSSAFANATMFINVIAAPPITATISPRASDLLLSWTGGLAPYQAQVSTNLSRNSWSNLGPPISSNSVVITSTNDAAFYRILGQ